MSSLNEVERDIISEAESICRAEHAVFTLSQTKEIVDINKSMLKPIIKHLKELECKINSIKHYEPDNKLELELKKLECVVNGLVEYDEQNNVNLCKLSAQIKKVESDLCDLDKKVQVYLCEQAKELDRVVKQLKELECKVKELLCKDNKDSLLDDIKCLISNLVTKEEFKRLKCHVENLEEEVRKLACREYKDERIEDILKRLACLEKYDFYSLEKKVERIELMLSCFVTKEAFDKLVKRVECLEKKDWYDSRVDKLVRQVADLEKRVSCVEAINCEQSKEIKYLKVDNEKLHKEIYCLTEKVNRNSCILDSKIQDLEKAERCEEKLDAIQGAKIEVLQSQVSHLIKEMDKLQHALLLKPVCK